MHRTILLLAATALALATVLHAATARAEDVTQDPDRAAVARALLALETDQGWTTAEIRQRLYRIGDGALPGILDALERVVPKSRAAEVIGDFLGTQDPRVLEKTLGDRLGEEPAPSDCLRLLRLMGRLSDVRVLPLAAEVAGKIDGSVLADPRVGAQWQATLKALVGERPALRDLTRGLAKLPPALGRCTADVLVRIGSVDAVTAVVDLLGRHPESRASLLGALLRAHALDLRVEGLASVVDRLLRAKDPVTRAEAAELAVRARLGGLVPDLVAGLKASDARVKTATRRALRALASTDRGAAPEGWREWLAAESAWRESADVSARLAMADPGEVAAALRDVTAHRLICRDVLDQVLALARHGVAPVRRLACATLGVLGRLEAARPLAKALGDEDATVRHAAAQALQILTGENLGTQPAAWVERLGAR